MQHSAMFQKGKSPRFWRGPFLLTDRRRLFAWTGQSHSQSAAAERLVMQRFDSLLCLLWIAHFHKAEAARASSFTVHDDVSSDDIAAAAEMCAQGITVNVVAEIGHIKIGLHSVLSKVAQAFQR